MVVGVPFRSVVYVGVAGCNCTVPGLTWLVCCACCWITGAFKAGDVAAPGALDAAGSKAMVVGAYGNKAGPVGTVSVVGVTSDGWFLSLK